MRGYLVKPLVFLPSLIIDILSAIFPPRKSAVYFTDKSYLIQKDLKYGLGTRITHALILAVIVIALIWLIAKTFGIRGFLEIVEL